MQICFIFEITYLSIIAILFTSIIIVDVRSRVGDWSFGIKRLTQNKTILFNWWTLSDDGKLS